MISSVARGKLRIYLGAAPGVGKTYAMLGEGHRGLERGSDVVVAVVETHGRPHTARSCCSNWLVTHASMVRCPELWGRGAISFTTTEPSESTKNSTAKCPT